jgi:hypothetical protein
MNEKSILIGVMANTLAALRGQTLTTAKIREILNESGVKNSLGEMISRPDYYIRIAIQEYGNIHDEKTVENIKTFFFKQDGSSLFEP